MKNERETTGTANAQGSGTQVTSETRSSQRSNTSSSGANMNPEAEGMSGWAGTQGRTSALNNIGDRLSRQYSNLTQTQKVVGASLLAGAVVGTAYLTRNMWGGNKHNWMAAGQESLNRKTSRQPGAKATAERQGSQRSSEARNSGSRRPASEMTM